MKSVVTIAGHSIGPGLPSFVIAEAGVNHNGSQEMACRMIDVAVSAGADAVKFQTFKASKVISPAAEKAAYQRKTTGEKGSQLEMAQALELSFDDFRALKQYCDSQNIIFLSTPFDEESVEFLQAVGVHAFKVSSGDLTNDRLLRQIARHGKPIVLSTGMSTLEEVRQAFDQLRDSGAEQLVLLHCVSNYPASPASMNLPCSTPSS